VAVDLASSPDIAALAERTAAFVRDVVIPVEVMRLFRVYDGPSQTHRRAIARRVLRGHDAAAAR
jgi:hypothetical protein